MSARVDTESLLWTLFCQLQRHRFPLGVEDFLALQISLRAGFGWSSKADLRALCCALWAKSLTEQAVVETLFNLLPLEDWTIDVEQSTRMGDDNFIAAQPIVPNQVPVVGARDTTIAAETSRAGLVTSDLATPNREEAAVPVVVAKAGTLPQIPWQSAETGPATHVFMSQFPVDYRTVAQTWRRLRWLVREGPKIELDVQETIAQRTRTGVATPPVLRSPRRNRARLLLLIDRQGSMAPFHAFVAEVCDTIRRTSRMGNVAIAYFHDVPLEGADPRVLDALTDPASMKLDPVMQDIVPLISGSLFDDPDLRSPRSAGDLLNLYGVGASIVLISDAGAARGHSDLLRLLDTVAFLKAIAEHNSRVVWLNPMPARYWPKTTAAQIARHVPMFPLDFDGMHQAVNVLRGHPFVVEKALE